MLGFRLADGQFGGEPTLHLQSLVVFQYHELWRVVAEAGFTSSVSVRPYLKGGQESAGNCSPTHFGLAVTLIRLELEDLAVCDLSVPRTPFVGRAKRPGGNSITLLHGVAE